MWLAKRVLVDGWDVNRAVEEATALGLTNASMKQFILDQIEVRRKKPA
jgi:hypothetical protein